MTDQKVHEDIFAVGISVNQISQSGRQDLIEKNIMADILKYRKNFTTTKYMKAVLVSLKDSVNGHLHMKTRRDFMAKLLIEYGEDIVYFDSENFASCQMHIKLFQELGN